MNNPIAWFTKGSILGTVSSPLQRTGAELCVDLKNLVGRCTLLLPIGLALLSLFAASVQAQTLRVWGDNASSEISGAPEGDFKAVAGGAINGLALRWDRTPVLWGSGPIGPPPIPEALASEKFFDVTIGRDDGVLIRLDGTLAAFGRNGPITSVPAGSYFEVAVAAGWGFSIGLSTDGMLWGWGTPFKSPFAAQPWTFASQGWIRYGDTGQYYIPNERFKSIAAAAFHIMAISTGRRPVR